MDHHVLYIKPELWKEVDMSPICNFLWPVENMFLKALNLDSFLKAKREGNLGKQIYRVVELKVLMFIGKYINVF